MRMDKIKIETDFIRLDQLLKWADIVSSGGEAKYLISEGMILLNGEVCLQRGKKIKKGDKIEIELENKIKLTVE